MLVLTCAYVRVRRLAHGIARFRIRVLDSVQLGKRLGLRERRNLVAQLREFDGGEELAHKQDSDDGEEHAVRR